MTKVLAGITMSVDGYVAGPNQSVTHRLSEGGDELHKWAFAVRTFRAVHGMEPLLVGDGARLFDNTRGRQTAYECIRVVNSPSVIG